MHTEDVPVPNDFVERNPYEDEIRRLKSHLLQLDEDINKATEERNTCMTQLQEELRLRDSQIAALQAKLREATVQQADSAINQDLTDQLRTDNEKLRQIISDMSADLREKTETATNLQTAVNMLQNTMNMEIENSGAKLRERITDLERQLAQHLSNSAASQIDKEANEELVALNKKLVKDVDHQNILIDQLNDEVNGLKKRLESKNTSVEKVYIRSLIFKLLKPPASVERSQLWDLLAYALDMTSDEHAELIETVRTEGGDAVIRQGLSDVWVDGLLNNDEAQSPKLANNTSPSNNSGIKQSASSPSIVSQTSFDSAAGVSAAPRKTSETPPDTDATYPKAESPTSQIHAV